MVKPRLEELEPRLVPAHGAHRYLPPPGADFTPVSILRDLRAGAKPQSTALAAATRADFAAFEAASEQEDKLAPPTPAGIARKYLDKESDVLEGYVNNDYKPAVERAEREYRQAVARGADGETLAGLGQRVIYERGRLAEARQELKRVNDLLWVPSALIQGVKTLQESQWARDEQLKAKLEEAKAEKKTVFTDARSTGAQRLQALYKVEQLQGRYDALHNDLLGVTYEAVRKLNVEVGRLYPTEPYIGHRERPRHGGW